jgi:hypothetical protein
MSTRKTPTKTQRITDQVYYADRRPSSAGGIKTSRLVPSSHAGLAAVPRYAQLNGALG